AYDNGAKPTGLEGTTAIWSLPRAQAQTIPRASMAQVIEGVERAVPRAARLGTVIGAADWEYTLFGPDLRRRLVSPPSTAAPPSAPATAPHGRGGIPQRSGTRRRSPRARAHSSSPAR